MRHQSTVLFANVISALFVVSHLHIASCDERSTSIEMISNGDERVVDEGTFNITCRFLLTNIMEIVNTYDRNVTWTLPEVYSGNKLKTDYHYDRQTTTGPPPYNITITSTLTVHNATSKETGYYSCAKTERRRSAFPNQTQYIYIKGKDYVTLASNKAVLKRDMMTENSDTKVFLFEADKGMDVVIPLKRIQPFVEIVLQYRTHVKMATSTNTRSELIGDILYTYDHGLILRNVTPSDSGVFTFSGQLLKSTSTVMSNDCCLHGIDLVVVGGDEIEEGGNVTLLVCFALSEFTQTPIWRYGKKRDRLEDIDEHHPPEELESLKVNITHTSLEEEPQVSTLQLFNVTRHQFYNNYFECTARQLFNKRNQRATSNGISIRFKSKEKETEIVNIELGEGKTLRCATADADDVAQFQWFQVDKKTISVTAGRPSVASEFEFSAGVPGEAGLYECAYTDEFGGQENRRAFVVKLHESNSITTIIKTTLLAVISLIVLIASLVAVAIGLFRFYCSRIVIPNAEKLLEGYKRTCYNTEGGSEAYDKQPYSSKRWEFPKNRLKLSGVEIGAGCFGRVVKGEATGILRKRGGEHVTTVAVKMVKSQSLDVHTKIKCLVAELKILIYLGPHVNVIGFLGACTKDIIKGELFVILEYCRYGNLKTFLKDQSHEFASKINNDDSDTEAIPEEKIIPRWSKTLNITSCANEKWDVLNKSINNRNDVNHQIGQFNSDIGLLGAAKEAQSYGNNGNNVGKDIIPPSTFHQCWQKPSDEFAKVTYSTRDLISWSWQITRGMEHLAHKKVVHGDLAARNILLADNGVVKIADFGLAHRTYYKEHFNKEEKGPLPVKWMAIESLTNNIFTSQSDVWSYGVVLWELFSLGKTPYPRIEGKRLVNELKSGYRMDKPTYAPDFIGKIMKSCWQKEPKKRPSFEQLEGTLFKHLHSLVSSHYLQLGSEP